MHICIVHQYYLTADGSGGSRFNAFARYWTEMGHRVTVVCGVLDYVSGEIPTQYRNKIWTEEWDNDVRVLRCWVPESYSKSYVGRSLAFAGFSASSVCAALPLSDIDVVIATSPPLTTGLTGWLIANARMQQVPWVFEVRDLWPESAVTTGVIAKQGIFASTLYRLERFLYRHADHIAVLTPAFADDIVDRGLGYPQKMTLLPNGADMDLFGPGPRDNAFRKSQDWGDKFVVMYAGAHGRANALDQLLETAEVLKDRDDIVIVTVGGGTEYQRLKQEAAKRELTNVQFLGPHPKSQMPEIIQAADVGCAVLQNNPTFKTVYPNKVFDYMACAKPILLGIDGVARTLVCEKAQAGVFAEPENAQSLATQILTLADDSKRCQQMGERGYRWVSAHATREAVAERYISVLDELVRTHRDNRGYRVTKRAADLFISASALAASAPLLALIACAVRIDLGESPWFTQKRPGLSGQLFDLVKFKTMRSAKPGEGVESDHKRLSAFGQWLRKTSLDELPSLWNILKGEMSLVGPRPLLRQYIRRYSDSQAKRHQVMPGLTGLAQVKGRNGLSWEQKFDLDQAYVAEASWGLDLKVLYQTIGAVLTKRGISSQGHATMPEFQGDITRQNLDSTASNDDASSFSDVA